MSRRDDMQHTPDERRALEALQGLDRPRASSEARARAKAAFLAGEAPAEAPAPAPASTPAPVVPIACAVSGPSSVNSNIKRTP